MVRESLRPGKRVGEVARRYGLSRWQLSTWRRLAREGKLEVDGATGRVGSVVIEAREVTVRLDGAIDASRVAEIASALRGLR